MAPRRAALVGLFATSFGIGASLLIGWSLDVRALMAVVPGQVTMKPNTAVCFVLSAVALASLASPGGMAGRARLRAVCAWLVIALAGSTLLEYLVGRGFGIDEALFHEPVLGSGSSHPGRMAPNSAFNFLLLGTAFLLSRSSWRHAARLTQGGLFGALFVTLLAALGYVYRAQVLVGLLSLNRMALHTIVGFVAVGSGLLVATSDRAWVGELWRTRSARAVASRLLPAALVVPVSVGAVVLTGYRVGLYDTAFAACLMAGAEVMSFTLLTWLTVRTLNAFEEEKTVAQMDALTGLRARRGFVLEATEMLDACRRAGRSAALLFVYLDGMKKVNDEQGHRVGDEALAEMASVLRSVFRSTDVVARLGGDEFVVLCSAATAATATEMVERLASKLEAANAAPGRRYVLACSAGFAVADAGAETSLDELLALADADMYRVKRARRALAAPVPAGHRAGHSPLLRDARREAPFGGGDDRLDARGTRRAVARQHRVDHHAELRR